MPRFEVGGVGLHYQRFGRGPEIVLLHGLTGNVAFWHPRIVTALAEDHHVTLLDFRGHGRSDSSPTGHTTQGYALDVERLLDHLGVERATVIGHSYGGAVALHVAALRPARVHGLVIADARIRSLQPASGLAQWEQWPRVRERLAAGGIHVAPEVVEQEFGLLGELARLRVAGRLDGLDLRPFFVPFATGSRRVAERWLQLIEQTRALDEIMDVAGLTPDVIAAVAAPTLAVFGALSHCWPSARRLGELLARCEVVSVPDVGHFHPLIKPDVFVAHVREFLRAIEPAACAPAVELDAVRPGH